MFELLHVFTFCWYLKSNCDDRNLLYNGKNTMQAWGLIVLLISKAAGHAPTIPDMEQDKSAGVLHSQRALAEVTEMIRISHLVHRVSGAGIKRPFSGLYKK